MEIGLGAIILGITLLFGALEAVVKHIDVPRWPTLSQAANVSERTSLRAENAETVAVEEIVEP